MIQSIFILNDKGYELCVFVTVGVFFLSE
jgi:hypothetical protein